MPRTTTTTTTTNSTTTTTRQRVPAAVKRCFKDSPYLRCLFKFINYQHTEDVAIDVVVYLHANGTVVRTGRYNHANRIVRILKAIKPDDIVNWFNHLAYGKENPAENEKPQFARANTLYSNKKKLSYYMINRSPHWNHEAQTGNPTKDKSVNDLLKKIKKFECRGTGKQSLSSQAFNRPEMILITNGAQDLQDVWSFQHPALITLQNTIIARNDDMNHIAANELKVNLLNLLLLMIVEKIVSYIQEEKYFGT